MVKNGWKKFDKKIVESLKQDTDLINFWSKYFPIIGEADTFIKKCLQKIDTRRMMLRVKWYTDISNGIPKVKNSRPALQIIFLVAMAESLARRQFTKKQAHALGSQKLVLHFFKFITPTDKNNLRRGFRRALTSVKHHTFLFSSIIKIIYQIRNDAVHGEEYWGFSLSDSQQNSGVSMLTAGYLGKPHNRRRVGIEIQLTYEDLRDIFIRTAIENIKSKFI